MPRQRSAIIDLAKDPITGKPFATIYTPSDVTLKDMNAIQERFFGDFLAKNGKAFGLKFCEGCRSGLDRLIIKDIAALPGKNLKAKIGF
jgi:hypothetical protein